MVPTHLHSARAASRKQYNNTQIWEIRQAQKKVISYQDILPINNSLNSFADMNIRFCPIKLLQCYIAGTGRMNMFDLANLLDQDGNLQNEMMVMAFAATMLATIPVS